MNSIRLNQELVALTPPLIMGIVNATPDSFVSASRTTNLDSLSHRVSTLIDEGVDIIDIGAYSTRPNALFVSVEEETKRLKETLNHLRNEFKHLPPLSIDTFRANIAAYCIEEFGVSMINDIGGGTLDDQMFATISRLKVPYVLMHTTGSPETMFTHKKPFQMDNLIQFFSKAIHNLRILGVNDIILDPGFGFGKELEENYCLLNRLDELKIFDIPLLVGISRKSMIYKLLDLTPEESLNGTTVLHTISLLKGASILRVHDVKEAKEAVKIVTALSNNK